MNKYPQHEKAESVRDETQAIGEFLEWLSGPPHAICLATFHEHTAQCYEDGGWPTCGYSGRELQPVGIRFERLIAEFMGIDYKAYQAEKDAMLAEIRAKT